MSTNNKPQTAGIITIFLLAVIPLISNENLNEFYLLPRTVAWSLFATFALAFTTFKLKKTEGFNLPIPLLLFTGFFASSALGLAQVFSMPEWWLAFTRYGLYLAILICSMQLFRTDVLGFDNFSKGMVVFSLVGGAIALKGALDSDDIYAAFAPFGHKNFTAAALLIGLLASLRTAQSKHPVWGKLAILAIALCTVDIILLRTRGVWIAAVLASISLLIGSRLLRPAGSTTTVIPVKYIGVGFIVLLGGIIAFSSQPHVKDAVLETANIDLRFKYWRTSTEMLSEQPLTGIGPGQWKFNFAKHGLDGTNMRVANGETAILRPHNDYLWTFAENGVIGGALYIGFWLLILWAGAKKLKATEETDERMRLLASLAMIVGFMSYAMGEFPIERVDLTVPVLIAASFLLSKMNGRKVPARPILFAGLILALLSLHRSYTRMSAERHVKEINVGNDNQNPTQILNAFENIDLDVVDVDYVGNPLPYFKGLALMATSFNQNGQINQARMNEARDQFDQALEINPWNTSTINQYGNWYKYQDQLQKANEMYLKGIEISSLNIDLRLNRAEIFIRTNNPNGAALMLYNLYPYEGNQKYNSLVVQALRKLDGTSKHPVIQSFFDSVEISELNDSQLVWSFNRYKDNQP